MANAKNEPVAMNGSWMLYNFAKLVSYSAPYWLILLAGMLGGLIPDYPISALAFTVFALIVSVVAFILARHLRTLMNDEADLEMIKAMK